jgi:hypothetical protein
MYCIRPKYCFVFGLIYLNPWQAFLELTRSISAHRIEIMNMEVGFGPH